jgi:branched-chain amino acid transport system ATP-binding protein
LKTILQLKGVTAAYGDVQVLWGVDMEVNKGEIVALIGPNGAGKSTTLRTIAGLHKYWDGEINFMGESLKGMQSPVLVEKGICLVPEGRQLFAGMTVYDNLMMGAYRRNDKQGIIEDFEWVLSLFPALANRQKQLAGKLSGGEQQMCAIGRGLMSRPKLLMIDELSLGLAPVMVEKILEVVEKIHQNGTTLVIVEQDVNTALEIADRGYCLENGKIVLCGESKEMLGNKYVQEAFLGIS